MANIQHGTYKPLTEQEWFNHLQKGSGISSGGFHAQGIGGSFGHHPQPVIPIMKSAIGSSTTNNDAKKKKKRTTTTTTTKKKLQTGKGIGIRPRTPTYQKAQRSLMAIKRNTTTKKRKKQKRRKKAFELF